MKRDEVLKTLAMHRDELRQKHGVKTLALFGSVSRDEASEASDVDLLVEFDRPISLFDLAALELCLKELLGVSKVDVVMRDSIYPAIKEDILREAIHVS
jgi:uncharacterized protein